CGNSSARTKAVTITCRDFATEENIVDFYLSPNPASDYVICSFTSASSSQITIQVSDITGRLISQVAGHAENGSNKIDLDLTALAKGVYLVGLVSSEKNIAVKKLIVQ
ncbi:MAG: T9SS type A sorting domain-containing protein, partial [Bacteroidota bacterium]